MVLARSMRLAVIVVTFVAISIRKLLLSLAVLETLLEVSLVSVSVDPKVNAASVCLSELPFSNVGVAFGSVPDARFMPEAV